MTTTKPILAQLAVAVALCGTFGMRCGAQAGDASKPKVQPDAQRPANVLTLLHGKWQCVSTESNGGRQGPTVPAVQAMCWVFDKELFTWLSVEQPESVDGFGHNQARIPAASHSSKLAKSTPSLIRFNYKRKGDDGETHQGYTEIRPTDVTQLTHGQFDMIDESHGRSSLGIYAIEGDTLQVSLNFHSTRRGKDRPTDFRADYASPHIVYTFRRVSE